MSGVEMILSAKETCLGVLEKLKDMHGRLGVDTLKEIEGRLKKDIFNLEDWEKKALRE
jgi:hypothetical protein